MNNEDLLRETIQKIIALGMPCNEEKEVVKINFGKDESRLIFKYLLGCFIVSLVHLLKRCPECLSYLNKRLKEKGLEEFNRVEDVVEQLLDYLKKLDELKTERDIFSLSEEIMEVFEVIKISECFYDCIWTSALFPDDW